MAKILVTSDNLRSVKEDLYSEKLVGLDTETYGLNIFLHMFSLQLASAENTYYFNFHDYGEGSPHVWDREILCENISDVLQDHDKTWFIHNAKFDLHRLHNVSATLFGVIHCTQAIERILYNQYKTYSLDACLKRRGRGKNKKVEEYIKEHRLYEQIEVEGKKRKIKHMFYDKVPFDIMFEYGCDDAEEHRFLGLDQLKNIYDEDIYTQEVELIRPLHRVERYGVRIDSDYVNQGIEYETRRLQEAIYKANQQAQVSDEYRNGPKWLRTAFDSVGQEYDINPETGNPIFDKDALGAMESELATTIREIRRSEKYVGTYYSSFNYYADSGNGLVHANIKQAGTDTGRFSYSDPNLQNVPKEEDFEQGSIQVRKCFVPMVDHCFVMIDFDQQEYRLMLDYAGERKLINDIMEGGLDVHQAMGDLVGVSRKAAKTLNFGLLYGMGEEALAQALGITQAESRDTRKLYFSKLPKVNQLIKAIKDTARARGYIHTWAGRRLHFNKNTYYKAPNHLIQGGCGDIARRAMIQLDKYLIKRDSRMLVQVHDEILFEIPNWELDVVGDLQRIMEDTYKPMNGMKLTCGVEHSWTSWGKQDVVEGVPV